MSLLPIVLGALAGFGVFIAVAGWMGLFSSPTPTSPTMRDRLAQLDKKLLAGVGVGLALAAITRWWIGSVLLVAVWWWVPQVWGSKRRRQASIGKTEAVASWAEQLRDVVGASAGISEALVVTARLAPVAIRTDIEMMARRLQVEEPDSALRQLAVDLDDPVADEVIVALRLALSERGRRLSEVLSAIAEAARRQATASRQIEAARAQLWRQAAMTPAVMVVVMGLIVLMRRSYLLPYTSFVGQIVLLVVAVIWAASLKMMVQIAESGDPPRVLATVGDRGEAL